MQQAAANVLAQNNNLAFNQYEQNKRMMSNKLKILNQGKYRKQNQVSRGEGEMPSFDNLPMMNASINSN